MLRTLLTLTRDEILSFRRRVGGLERRLPAGPESWRRAAWAGLPDSMPRAGVLSLHARVEGVGAEVLDDPSLIQVWGPRYSVFVVAAEDRAVFTLGRWPDTEAGRARATLMADRLAGHLDGGRASYDAVGAALGINANALRYGSTTGTVLLRWDGARAPLIWSAPAPEVDPVQARGELVRRYLHVFGPGNAPGFAKWAGVSERSARDSFATLSGELASVATPLGEAQVLASDEEALRSPAEPAAGVRLLPSGDSHYLFWGADRELLVPDATRRGELWTSRVWPGAVLVDGELAGTWRRAQETVSVHLWSQPTRAARAAVEAEAAGLPILGHEGALRVVWT